MHTLSDIEQATGQVFPPLYRQCIPAIAHHAGILEARMECVRLRG